MAPPRRAKAPHDVRVLQRWVGEHARATGIAQQRVQRWISYMVVASALDAVRDEDDEPVFALKGGVALELRLGLSARATKDYDAAFRERAGDLLDRLDQALRQCPGDFTVTRTRPEAIRATGALRIDLKLSYRGRSWSTVRMEISTTQGDVGTEIDRVPAIPLDPFGVSGPVDVACVALRYQVAQKLHACTEQFADGADNDRFRDLIDLLLMRDLVTDGELPRVRAACVEIFELRARHAWPPTVTVFASWPGPCAALARDIGFAVVDVHQAAAAVQGLVGGINTAT